MRKFSAGIVSLLFVAGPSFADEPAKAEKEIKEAVTKTQFISYQRSLFDKADKDYDGIVSFGELNELRLEKNQKQSKERFKNLDIDFSGFITENEIMEAHKTFEERSLNRSKASKENLFKTYDLDNNGTISSYEIEEVFEKRDAKIVKDGKIRARKDFDIKDADKSGTVSLDEYLDNHAKYARNSGLYYGGEYISRDKNRDKMITRAENTALIMSLFGKLDKNDDGELSSSEQDHKAYSSFQTFDDNRFRISNKTLSTKR